MNVSTPAPEPCKHLYRSESFTIEIVKDGVPGDHTVDLTGVTGVGGFVNDADLAGLTGVLEPLRSWLESHDALNARSGLLVRCLDHALAPVEADEERARPGRVVQSRVLTVLLHEPQASASPGM